MLFFYLDFGSEPLRERSEVGGEEHTVCPASFLAPKPPEVVRNSIISRPGEATMFAFSEFIVTLCDLPDYTEVSKEEFWDSN